MDITRNGKNEANSPTIYRFANDQEIADTTKCRYGMLNVLSVQKFPVLNVIKNC